MNINLDIVARALIKAGEEGSIWNIEIDGDGKAVISVPGTEDKLNRFLFNKTSPRFKTYTSASSASMLLPTIYKNIPILPLLLLYPYLYL